MMKGNCGVIFLGKRVTKKERVLQKLKKGEPFSVIRKEEGSGSSVYAALPLYFDWASENIEGLQSLVKSSEGELKTKRKLLGVLSNEIEMVGKKNENLGRAYNDLSTDMMKLESIHSEKKGNLDRVLSDLMSLRKRGLTEDIIAEVCKIDFGSKDELLGRIGTLEAFQVLSGELKKLDVNIEDARSALARDDARLKSIRDEIVSQGNALDEVKRKRWRFNEANLVVQGFLQEGYNTELLLSLLEALGDFSIKGQPNTSIQRLVTGLSDYRRLEELQRACRDSQVELSRSKDELLEAQATLRAVKVNVLSMIQDAQVRSIRILEEQGKKLSARVERDLGEIKDKQIAQYEKIGEIATDHLIKVHNSALSKIQNASANLGNTLTRYERFVKEWGDQKQERGEFQEILNYAEIIRYALENTELLKGLPVYVIERLAFAITNWINYNDPEAKMRPDEGTYNLERNLSTYSEYKVLALSRMISDYMSLKAVRVS